MTVMINNLMMGKAKQHSNFPSEVQSDKHETPQYLYDLLNEEFHFTLDPCAEPHTAKCNLFFTEQDNGLDRDWSNQRVFVNPPYGKKIRDWLDKSISSGAELVVLLLPAYVESKWFQDIVLTCADEVRFCRGRLKFGKIKFIAPFSSAVIIFRKDRHYNHTVCKPLDLRSARRIQEPDIDTGFWEGILE